MSDRSNVSRSTPPNPPGGGGGNSCDGPNPSVVCLNNDPTPEPDSPAELVTVNIGGLNPAGIPGVFGDANNPYVSNIRGSKAVGANELLALINLITSKYAPKSPSQVDIFLSYYLLSNGTIDKMVITVNNHSGASNAYIDGVRLVIGENTPLRENINVRLTEPIIVRPGQAEHLVICENCLLTNNIVSSSALPIDSSLSVQVTAAIGASFDYGGAVGTRFGEVYPSYIINPR